MTESSTDLDDIPILSVNLTDIDKLYRAYMTFPEMGGLFIATNHEFELGDPVFVSLTLLDEKVPFRLKTQVIWVMKQALGTTQQGVGVALNDKVGATVKGIIETALAGRLKSDKPTDTI